MKVIALIFVFVAVASAAPQYLQSPTAVRITRDASKDAVIVRYDSDNIGVGPYSYGVETSDGQKKEERGELVDAGTKEPSIAVQGKYSYPGPDGVLYEVVYIADKDGFRAQGAHLPVAQIACIFALIAVAAAAPPLVRVSGDSSKDAVILRYDNDNIGVGPYSFGVETSDGQKKEERGELIDAGTKEPYVAVQGRYSYTGPDGVLYEVVYVADKDGYRAQGAHLPVAP